MLTLRFDTLKPGGTVHNIMLVHMEFNPASGLDVGMKMAVEAAIRDAVGQTLKVIYEQKDKQEAEKTA